MTISLLDEESVELLITRCDRLIKQSLPPAGNALKLVAHIARDA